MQKHNDAIKTSGHSSLEKYTSHFIWKGCVWEGVRDRTELQHIDPHSSGYNSISFPFSCLLNRVPGGPSLSWDMVRIPASSLQLPVAWGYIIIQPLDSQGRSWSPDIFDRVHMLFTQVHFFFWQLGRGKYVTIIWTKIYLVQG